MILRDLEMGQTDGYLYVVSIGENIQNCSFLNFTIEYTFQQSISSRY